MKLHEYDAALIFRLKGGLNPAPNSVGLTLVLCSSWSMQYYCPVSIEENSTLYLELHCTRKRDAFHIAARCQQLIGAVRVVDPFHHLFNDRPLVKIGRHIVGRCPDQF